MLGFVPVPLYVSLVPRGAQLVRCWMALGLEGTGPLRRPVCGPPIQSQHLGPSYPDNNGKMAMGCRDWKNEESEAE